MQSSLDGADHAPAVGRSPYALQAVFACPHTLPYGFSRSACHFMRRRRLLSVRMLSRVFFRAVIGIETSFSAGHTTHRTGVHTGEKTKRRIRLQYGAPLLKTQKFWRFFRRIASSIRLIKRKCPCKLNIPS